MPITVIEGELLHCFALIISSSGIKTGFGTGLCTIKNWL